MSEELEYQPLAATDARPAFPGMGGETDLRRLSDVPVDLTVEIGRTRMTVGETLQLRPGSIVSLNRTAGEPVDLLVNGTRIACGEVVVVDEEFGLRITEVLHDERAEAAPAAAAAAAPVAVPEPPLAAPVPPAGPMVAEAAPEAPLQGGEEPPGDDPIVDAVAA
jgi:flagellar motor switch protein FliN/FliY